MCRNWTEPELQEAFGLFSETPPDEAEGAATELLALVIEHGETSLARRLWRGLEAAEALGVSIVREQSGLARAPIDDEIYDRLGSEAAWELRQQLLREIEPDDPGGERWQRRMRQQRYRRWLLALLLLTIWLLFFRAALVAEGRYTPPAPEDDGEGDGREAEAAADMSPQLRPPGYRDDNETPGLS